VKKLFGIVVAIVAVLAMTVPAYADVTTSVTVGNGGATQPKVLAMAVVPDDGTGTTGAGQVEVDPESALPVSGDFLPSDMLSTPGSDGWKRVKFYIVAYHPAEFEFNINKVMVNVYYDQERTNRKFQLDGTRTGTSHTWVGTQSYNSAQYYPAVAIGDSAELAVLPAWTARERLYTLTQKDMIDVNADDVYVSEPNVIEFLTTYGNRVHFDVSDPFANVASIENLLLEEQAIVLELTGFMWFHQPAQTYFWEAKVSSNGSDSDPLDDSFVFNKKVSFFMDATSVTYGATTPNADVSSQAPADRWLSTPGYTTIWDNGNTNAQVSVRSTKMVLNWDGQGANPVDYTNALKTIVDFDAALYYATPLGASVQVGHINYGPDTTTLIQKDGSNPVELGTPGPVLLQACRPAKIEFSARAGNVWQGNYGGRLTISVAEYAGSQTEVNIN
jgi:hypothetical protein